MSGLHLTRVRPPPDTSQASTCHESPLHLHLQGSLEAYVAAARARQDKTFVAEYPVLRDMLQGGLQGLSAL